MALVKERKITHHLTAAYILRLIAADVKRHCEEKGYENVHTLAPTPIVDSEDGFLGFDVEVVIMGEDGP